MNKKTATLCLTLLSLSFVTSCRRSTDEVVNDTRTASRHVRQGVWALGGKHNDSRAIRTRDELYGRCDLDFQDDFVPLSDVQFGNDTFIDSRAPQPRINPGDPGSPVPGIESFVDPSTIPEVAGVFKNIRFEYDSNLIKGDDNLNTVRKIVSYMRAHPNSYVFVEGHCDERGGEAYNLALGARRSNAVRAYLINEGVNPDHVFTISYGRERPLIIGTNENAWSQNRRAEFKIYFER